MAKASDRSVFNCISVGDAIYDVFLTIHDAEVHCRLRDEDCELCLKYGQKIPVDKVHRSLGGNAANNAIGLRRLGNKVAFLSVHGDDQIGQRIDEALKKEGISLDLVTTQRNSESRYSTIISFMGERTILEYNFPHDYKFPQNLPKTEWLYLSSVGPNYRLFFEEVAKFISENKVKLAFTPNNQQLHSDLESYQGIIENCQTLFMNKEEAALLLRKEIHLEVRLHDTKESLRKFIKNMLSDIYELGPGTVVITDGTKGSYCYDGDKYYFLPIFDFPAVEMTGAGDAYASAFLGAMMRGLPTAEAMRWGTFNAGSVVSQIGAQKGLLTLEEMKEFLRRNSSFRAIEI